MSEHLKQYHWIFFVANVLDCDILASSNSNPAIKFTFKLVSHEPLSSSNELNRDATVPYNERLSIK